MKYLTKEDMDFLKKEKAQRASHLTGIIREVSRELQIPIPAIMGKSRCLEVIRARQLVMYVAMRAEMNPSHVGRMMGVDRTTVIHGFNAEQKRRQTNEV